MKRILPFVLLFSTRLFSQEEHSPKLLWWASAGGGITSVQNLRPELSAGFSANAVYRKQLFGARLLFCEELVVLRTALKTNELALYYGRYFLNEERTTYAALGGGVSFVNYYTYGAEANTGQPFGTYYLLEPNYTCGIALDAQAGLHLFRYVGIGVHGFVSANVKRTLAGAMLSVRVGHLYGD